MFKKSGTKIKLIAKILFGVGVAVSVVVGALIMLSAISQIKLKGVTAYAVGLAIIVIGSLASYVSALVLHAYGEIVDKTKDSNYLLTRIADHTKHLSVDVDRVVRDPGFSMPASQPAETADQDSGSFAPNHRV